MKTHELIKLVEAQNFFFLRHGGCHDIYMNPATKETVAIPRHTGEVKIGTAKGILKQVGFVK